MTQPILIAGGGIAGLAAKVALAAHGVHADLAERGTAPTTAGAGLYLPANAVRVLRDLGLMDELERRSVPILRQEVRDHDGSPLAGFELDQVWGEVGESRAIRRTDLHGLLSAAAGTSGLRMGVAIREAHPDGTVTFSDGTQQRYDVVVGADGIDSAVRDGLFPHATKHFLQQICWRFLAPVEIARHTWAARLGNHGRTVLTVPVGDGETYVFAAANSDTPIAPDGDWRHLFADFAEPVGQLLEHGRAARFAALYEVPNADWVAGHVVLIGDAAHACSPSMAQGGALALEDAWVLAEELTRAPIPEALARYRLRRAPRVAFVIQQNHRRDRARNLPAFVRRALFRRAGLQVIRGNHARLLARP